MPERALQCLRCSGPMEQGFVADKAHYSIPEVQNWVEGVPERSFWSGIRLKGKGVLPVKTYRCEQCGYLESYAEA